MAQPIAPDYATVFLFPPCLEDWVPQDHYVRFLRELVDGLDLPALGFVVPTGSEGRPPYAASLLLKIWLFGYVHKVFSSRKLEQACTENLPLLWLTGLVQPDHNSIWRFWRDNKKALGELFKHTVRLAVKVGLVGLALQAVDGTKIQAVASNHSGWTKEGMEKRLQELDQVVEQAETQVQAQEQLPGLEPQAQRLPRELASRQQLKEKVQAGLAELAVNGRGHYHPQEPEALRMKCEGRNRFAYNAQAVADAQVGIVTAAEVAAQETDVNQLTPMLQSAQANVGSATAVAVADTGYGSAEDLAQAEQAGFTVIAPLCEGKPNNHPYHASQFTYRPQIDQVICPQGQALSFEREKDRRGVPVRVFRCHCADCPVRDQCTRDKRGRMIEIGPHHATVVAHRQQLGLPENQAKLRRRAVIIEPVFATIKQRLGFRRWTVRGLINVRAQWSLLCLTVNLIKLWTVWQKGAWLMDS